MMCVLLSIAFDHAPSRLYSTNDHAVTVRNNRNDRSSNANCVAKSFGGLFCRDLPLDECGLTKGVIACHECSLICQVAVLLLTACHREWKSAQHNNLRGHPASVCLMVCSTKRFDPPKDAALQTNCLA